jgi:putative transposase
MRILVGSEDYIDMTSHRRRLPHIYPEGAALFLTWHLYGSVPTWLKPPPGPLSSGEAFVWLDRRLDTLRSGPLFLRQPEIARLLAACIHKGVELGHYGLFAWVIMPNHFHLLIRPIVAPQLLLKSLKGASARECNRLLGRTGEPFWQKESYDHWVRNERRIWEDLEIYRKQSGEGWAGEESGGVVVV